MEIWLRNTSLLGARCNFVNGHDEIPEEVIKACAGIKFLAPSSKFKDIVFIRIGQLCEKLRDKKLEEEAKWLEKNCPGTIILKTSNVNVFNSINYKDLGGYSNEEQA